MKPLPLQPQRHAVPETARIPSLRGKQSQFGFNRAWLSGDQYPFGEARRLRGSTPGIEYIILAVPLSQFLRT